MLGRDVLIGVDPGIALMAWAALVIAVLGGMWLIFYWLVRQLGWAA